MNDHVIISIRSDVLVLEAKGMHELVVGRGSPVPGVAIWSHPHRLVSAKNSADVAGAVGALARAPEDANSIGVHVEILRRRQFFHLDAGELFEVPKMVADSIHGVDAAVASVGEVLVPLAEVVGDDPLARRFVAVLIPSLRSRHGPALASHALASVGLELDVFPARLAPERDGLATGVDDVIACILVLEKKVENPTIKSSLSNLQRGQKPRERDLKPSSKKKFKIEISLSYIYLFSDVL